MSRYHVGYEAVIVFVVPDIDPATDQYFAQCQAVVDTGWLSYPAGSLRLERVIPPPVLQVKPPDLRTIAPPVTIPATNRRARRAAVAAQRRTDRRAARARQLAERRRRSL